MLDDILHVLASVLHSAHQVEQSVVAELEGTQQRGRLARHNLPTPPSMHLSSSTSPHLVLADQHWLVAHCDVNPLMGVQVGWGGVGWGGVGWGGVGWGAGGPCHRQRKHAIRLCHHCWHSTLKASLYT